MASDIGIKLGVEGEKEFKKALADINSSFKVLGSEMKFVESQFDKNEKSVGSLTAKNEVLNKEIEAQKAKIETLRSALKNASDSFGENDKRTQNWRIQLNNAEAALNDMEREVASNEKAIDEMSGAEEDAEKDTKNMSKAVKDSGDTAQDAGGKFDKFKTVVADVAKATAAAVAAIGAAAVAAGKALWNMANDTAEYGDEIEKNSQKVGLSYESYQKWDYAMKICGTEMSSCTTGLKTLTNTFDDAVNGSASATAKFERLGLSMDDIKGLSREDLFSTVVTALQNVSDETEKAALANDMFGKSGQELLPLFNMSSEELQGLMQECEDYGMVMSDEAVEASAQFEDSLTKLKSTFTGLKNRMMGDVLPAMGSIMDGLSDLIAGNEGASDKIKEGVGSLIDSITAMIPQLIQLLSTIAQAVLESAPEIVTALAEGIIDALPQLVPVVVQIVEKLIYSLIELLPKLVEAAAQVVVSLVTGIADALPKLVPAIVEVVITIVQTLLDNLPMILDAALQLVKGLAQGILDAIPVLIDALPEVILSIVNFILDAIPQIIETGIELLTSLVAALPDIIKKIVEAIPEIINGIITAVIEAIPQIIQAGIDLLVSLIQALPDIIVTIVNAIPEIINGIVNALIGNIDKIIMAGVQLFVALIENLPTIIVEIVKAVPQIIGGIVSAFGSMMGNIVEIGGNIVKGLWDGITGLASWLWDKVTGWISDIWDGICSFFGIFSPSRKMKWAGEMMTKGLAGGIEETGDQAVEAVTDMGEDIDHAMQDIAGDMTSGLPENFDFNANAHVNTVTDGAGGISSQGGGLADIVMSLRNSFTALEESIDRKLSGFENVERYLSEIAENSVKNIYLDTGVLVGATASGMDRALGRIDATRRRTT